VADIGGRVLPAAALGAEAAESLRALAEAADAVGVGSLTDAVELAWVDTVLRDVVRGQQKFADVEIALHTGEARDRVRTGLAHALSSMDVAAAMEILEWTVRSGIELDERTLRPTGDRVFGPEVLARRLDDGMRALLDRLAPLRWGAVDHLAVAVHTDIGAVVAALGSGVGELLEVKEEHELAVAVVLADVRHGHRRPADALREIAQDGFDQAVMTQLWPAGGWSHAEAIEVVSALRPEDRRLPIVLAWLADALLTSPAAGEGRLLDRLCNLVLNVDLKQDLPAEARERIESHVSVTLLIDQMVHATDRDFDDLLDKVRRSYHPSGEQRRAMIVTNLLNRLEVLSTYRMAMVLVRLSDVRAAYLADLLRDKRPSISATTRHALITWLVRTDRDFREWGPAGEELARAASVLRDKLRRNDLKAVIGTLEPKYAHTARWFTDLSRRPGGLSRVLRPRRWWAR
jgi:hypothetical protein